MQRVCWDWIWEQSSKEDPAERCSPWLAFPRRPTAGRAAARGELCSAQPGAAAPVSDCAHSVSRDLFFSFCSHIFFCSHCVHHTSKSTASAANLWSSVICFADFLPKVMVCSTTVQYLFFLIFTIAFLPHLQNDISSQSARGPRSTKQNYQIHFISSLLVLHPFSQKCCLHSLSKTLD